MFFGMVQLVSICPFIYLVCMCICCVCTYHSVHVEVRIQLVGIFLLPCGVQVGTRDGTQVTGLGGGIFTSRAFSPALVISINANIS